ncbi:M14 family metallopeptidase [Virgibacillus oceani]
MSLKRFMWSFVALAGVVMMIFTSLELNSSSASSSVVEKEPPETAVVEIVVPDEDAAENLVSSGYELSGYASDKNGQLEVHVIATEAEIEMLEMEGYEPTVIQTSQDVEKILEERERKLQQGWTLSSVEDNINVFRAEYFTNMSETFLYLEAKSSAGSNVSMNATWEDGNGEEQTASMRSKVDYGEYLYHYVLTKIDDVPENVTITSSQQGSVETGLTEWLSDGTPIDDDYLKDFITHYMEPMEIEERIIGLAEEFPELAEIVELPYETNGYRRHAQATIGETVDAAFVITSEAWGHEGGNDISINIDIPEEENADLGINVDGDEITVTLGTDDAAQPNSTANDVIGVLNDQVGDLVTATNYRDSNGNGVVQAEADIELTDGLNAPAEISREPETVKAIRIGKERDGSNPGVLGYSQEHAREWVTPLVSVETAERLLRNYHIDEDTQELVDNLDIFIVPTVNPDGGNYSFYDYNMQRKNMTNHCPAETADPAYSHQWGVDLNRNHAVGSVYDGWIGGSTNCLSGTYAGPEIESEPEAKNIVWLAEEFPNIEFAMNIHAHGGYFMWSPGAYDADRNPLPRPTAGEEAYYWQASEHILTEIKNYRGTVIHPGRTGPIPDVLYSAGGNSADALWYDHGIYAWNFEVGAQLWNEERERWESVGFQPEYEEGHAEAMEFANGLIGLFEVALANANDDVNPETWTSPEAGTYHDPVEIDFEMSEPATVYYTLDGSRPTLDSEVINVAGTRMGGETLEIKETTTIKWFSVDPAGNVENDYDPSGEDNNYNEAEIVIDYLPEGVSAAGIQSLVERFEGEGEFADEAASRNLKNHLTAVALFENQGAADKVVRHMNSFLLLLNHQENNDLISSMAYRILEGYANELIELWSSELDGEEAM